MFQRRGSHVPNRIFFIIGNQPTPRALQIYFYNPQLLTRIRNCIQLVRAPEAEKTRLPHVMARFQDPLPHTHSATTTKEWVERPVVEVNFELRKQRQMGWGWGVGGGFVFTCSNSCALRREVLSSKHLVRKTTNIYAFHEAESKNNAESPYGYMRRCN